jgi:purine-nucleoside phosphorylase
MSEIYEKLERALASVRAKTDFVPRVALTLGSGLGNYADHIEKVATVSYKDIEGFPVSTAPGHKGQFVFGYVDKVPVVVMQGRVHFYEGYDMTDVVMPVRLMKLFGAETFFVTNASGGINSDFSAGDLMLITDQISFFLPSPLRGSNIDELGNRFPDMSHIYDEDLQALAKDCAAELNIPLKEGVYVQTKGPNYESPAEIRFLKTIGADAVGMSTACETIAANHMGMKILGISVVSNLAAGISPTPLTEEEVLEAGRKVEPEFTGLVDRIISKL